MKSRQFEMQSYEFEMMLQYMTSKVAEFGMAPQYDRLDLADILISHDVTTVDRLPDVVTLARNLQSGITVANPEPSLSENPATSQPRCG
jgi:ABC-type glutathione transport system ATPase component